MVRPSRRCRTPDHISWSFLRVVGKSRQDSRAPSPANGEHSPRLFRPHTIPFDDIKVLLSSEPGSYPPCPPPHHRQAIQGRTLKRSSPFTQLSGEHLHSHAADRRPKAPHAGQRRPWQFLPGRQRRCCMPLQQFMPDQAGGSRESREVIRKGRGLGGDFSRH